MATFGANTLTLADWAKRLDPNGNTATITELLTDTNEILADMAWLEGNLPTGHKTTIRTGLPTVAWRLLNYGVQPSKSTTRQITDTCGMLEAYSEVDKALADLNGNTSEFRLSEDRPFLEAMNQEMASTLFYGAATAPEEFVGLAARYSGAAQTSDPDLSTYNVLDAGGDTSTCSSMWLVVWGPNTVHGIFPKGSKAGLAHEDLGKQTLIDAAGGKYEGYRTHYKWDCGVSVRDWRYVVRIANIDIAVLNTYNTSSDTSANLPRLMRQALNRIPQLGLGRPAFYCNRAVKDHLDVMLLEGGKGLNGTNHVIVRNGGGLDQPPVSQFAGVPIRRCDALLSTEVHQD